MNWGRRLFATSTSTVSSAASADRWANSAKLLLKRLEAEPSPEKRSNVLHTRMSLMKNRTFWKPLIQVLQKKAKTRLLCVEVFDWIRREIPDVGKSQIYANMIAYAGSIRKPELAHVWLLDMRKRGIKMTTSTYNALVSVLCRNGETQEATQLLEKMKRADCSPNISTYNTILAAYGRNMKLTEMEKWLENININSNANLSPNVVTYNILLFSYFKMGKLCNVEEILDKMHAAGCQPDTFTFAILLDGYEKFNMVERMASTFDERQKSGLPFCAVAAQQMVELYAHRGMIDRLKLTVEGFPSTAYTTRLNSVILNSYIRAGDMDEAELHLRRVTKRGIAFVESEVLEEFIRRSSKDVINWLYQSVKTVTRWKLNASTYELLIRFYAEHDQHEQAVMVASDMEEKAGWKWSMDTMQVLYDVFKKDGNRSGLELILEKMKVM